MYNIVTKEKMSEKTDINTKGTVTNMNKNLTEIVYILDRSGSMSGLEADTIGGYNAFLGKQRAEEGEAVVTTVLFDDKYEMVHDRADIKKVEPLTDKEYYARGSTALLDAVGKTVNYVSGRHRTCLESEIPAKTIVVITTDGFENASREYDSAKVKEMIEHRKKEHGWEFIFLGANIDAVETAKDFGISKDFAASYSADREGTALNFDAVSCAVSDMRASRKVNAGWKRRIESHLKNTKK